MDYLPPAAEQLEQFNAANDDGGVLTKGATYYAVALKWLNRWRYHVGVVEAIGMDPNMIGPRDAPGPIDCADIADQVHNLAIRRGMVSGASICLRARQHPIYE